MKIFLVGGAVRDQILGESPKDYDWCVVGATQEDMLELNYKKVGADFPVFLHPETSEEYALARTERKSGRGHKGFVVDFSVDVTLEEDLARRDLTINAIAKTGDGDYIDPYGGVADLEKQVLRHVSESFREDPLRVLRVARFAARYPSFAVHSATLALMKEIVSSGELEDLTPERVWVETEKALGEKLPSRYIQVLRDCGALKVIFPEIDVLFGVPQSQLHHPEVDTGIHTLMVLDQAAILTNDRRVRFAALVHDLGKGLTPESKWPRHIGHEEKGVPLVEGMVERWRIPGVYRELAVDVARYHLRCHRAMEMQGRKIYRLLEDLGVIRRGEEYLLRFVQACKADSRGRAGFEHREYQQADILIAGLRGALSVTGQDLINEGVAPGKGLGDRLRQRRISSLKGAVADKKRTLRISDSEMSFSN